MVGIRAELNVKTDSVSVKSRLIRCQWNPLWNLIHTLNAKCSVVEKFRVFRALTGNRETFTPENGLILLNFKQCKCNTAKLFRRNTNVRAIRETFSPRNILRLRYCSFINSENKPESWWESQITAESLGITANHTRITWNHHGIEESPWNRGITRWNRGIAGIAGITRNVWNFLKSKLESWNHIEIRNDSDENQ